MNGKKVLFTIVVFIISVVLGRLTYLIEEKSGTDMLILRIGLIFLVVFIYQYFIKKIEK